MNQSGAVNHSHRTGGRARVTITIDADGLVTGWSPGAEGLLGRTSGEVLGRSLADLVIPDESLSLREGWRGEANIRSSDGRVVKCSAEVCTLTRQGESEWLLTVTAVPQHRQTHLSDQPVLDWIFTDSPIALTVYDRELHCVRQNAAMSRVIGMPENERRGRRLVDVLTGPDAAEWERHLRAVLQSGTPASMPTVRGRTPADPDHDHVFSATASPLRDSRGGVVGVCATVWDVTDAHRHRERLAILNEASARIGSTLEVSGAARELAESVVPGLADFVSVDLLEPLLRGEEPGPVTRGAELRRMAHLSVRTGTPERAVELGQVDHFPWHSPPARCLATGRPVLLRDMGTRHSRWFEGDPNRVRKAARYEFHSQMFVPVRARGVPLGVVLFCRSWPSEPFEQGDVDLAQELVTRAAISLDNARRFTRERTAALALQRSLLPGRLPERPALEAASRYRPALSQYGVGGDWFDVIPLSGARMALVVGDVVGHGIQASATMGRLRTAVRTLADVDLQPDELLIHLDDLVTQLGEEEADGSGNRRTSDMWATALYGIYDPVAGRASFASAGHPPPAALFPGGRTELLDVEPGPPLGLGSLQFEVRDVELPEGSELVLYTDGLISHRDLDIDEGLDRLRRSLGKPAASLDERCDSMLGDLLPDRPPEDVALLAARSHRFGDDRVAVLDVPTDSVFVARARSWASDQLTAWGLEAASFVTELVVSELVTNAIRYGAPPVQLRLINDRALICEVSDSSSTAPHLRRAQLLEEGGRGLLLMAQVTQHWGTRHTRRGKTIWCEQSLLDEGAAVT